MIVEIDKESFNGSHGIQCVLYLETHLFVKMIYTLNSIFCVVVPDISNRIQFIEILNVSQYL